MWGKKQLNKSLNYLKAFVSEGVEMERGRDKTESCINKQLLKFIHVLF